MSLPKEKIDPFPIIDEEVLTKICNSKYIKDEIKKM